MKNKLILKKTRIERKMKFVFAFPMGDHQASLHITLTLVRSSQLNKKNIKKNRLSGIVFGERWTLYVHRPPLHRPLKIELLEKSLNKKRFLNKYWYL